MQKKKRFALLMCAVMACVALVGGTMAYLTYSDSDVNVMTVGNVKIEQIEQERDGNDGLQDFTQNQAIVPAADVTGAKDDISVNGYNLKIRTGDTYVDKIVSVTNTGKSDAYVRTIIAFPEAGNFDTTWNAAEQWLHWNGVSDTDTTTTNGWMWGRDKETEWPGNADNWDVVENVTIGGKVYDLYVATNKNVIEPDESTAPSLLGFYIDPRVECDGTNYTFTVGDTVYNLGDISNLEILVASQAVQADGFANAWAALDEAFGDITETNHPWANVAFSAKDALDNPVSGVYSMKSDAILTDEPLFSDHTAAGAYTVNGNGNTVTMVASSDQTFDWAEGGTIPLMAMVFSSENGDQVTVNDLTITGTMQSVSAGNYESTNQARHNTVFNNVNIVDAEVVSFSAGISPALTAYGTLVMNNCNVYGTTLSALDTDPMWPVYDVAAVNYSDVTINDSTIGSLYMWNQAKVTVAEGSQVGTVVVRGNMNTTKYGLTVKSGATVGAIDLSAITNKAKVNITIEDGATVGKIVANGAEYASVTEWQNTTD